MQIMLVVLAVLVVAIVFLTVVLVPWLFPGVCNGNVLDA